MSAKLNNSLILRSTYVLLLVEKKWCQASGNWQQAAGHRGKNSGSPMPVACHLYIKYSKC